MKLLWETMIDILLSTYNGEKYLNEQIDSILNQTYTEWTLFIRDDGSSDGTQEIIRRYASQYSNIIQLKNTGNKGVIRSFEILLENSTSDYFMFCDQDDVWMPDKVERTLTLMHSTEELSGKGRPVVVHTDLEVVDSSLNTIHKSFFKFSNINPDLSNSNANYALIYNAVTGCTLMGNKAVRQMSLPFPPEILMHDSWIAQAALLNKGKVVTLYEATMLYRQHNNNVLGATLDKSIKGRLKKYFADYILYRSFTKSLPFIKYLFWKVRFYIKSHCNG